MTKQEKDKLNKIEKDLKEIKEVLKKEYKPTLGGALLNEKIPNNEIKTPFPVNDLL